MWPFRKSTTIRARLQAALDKAEHDMHDHATAAAYHQVLADLNENQQIADKHRALHEMNAQLVDRYRAEIDLIDHNSKTPSKFNIKEVPCHAPASTLTEPSALSNVFGQQSTPSSRLHFVRG